MHSLVQFGCRTSKTLWFRNTRNVNALWKTKWYFVKIAHTMHKLEPLDFAACSLSKKLALCHHKFEDI